MSQKRTKSNYTQLLIYLFQVRRCHLNDIENIIPFVLLGIMLVGVNPDAETAIMHFKVRLRFINNY